MLYLMKSAEYGKDENGKEGFFFSLKIGYTEYEETDISSNRRLLTYFAHHRSIELLSIIPNGTPTHEKKLHQKFRKYLWDGNEWYYYNQEIVDYFNSITLEELDELPIDLGSSYKIRKDIKEIKHLVSFLFDTPEDANNYLTLVINKLGLDFTFESAYNYIKDDSLISKDKFDHYLEVMNNRKTDKYCDNEEQNKIISNFIKTYDSGTFMDRLKLICNNDLINESLSIMLSQIPSGDPVKYYFLLLGPERIKQLGYNVTLIRKELGIVTFTPELLINSIYSDFKVGDKLLLSDIKDKLTNIYNTINYKAAPKAKDLENYFNIRLAYVYVTDPDTGKRKQQKAYELLESYEQEYRDKLMK